MSEPVIQDIPRETDGIKSGALSQIELDSPANKSHTIKVDESTTEVVKTAFYTDRLAKHSLFHEIASDNHKKPETENVFSETSSSRAHIQESSEDLSPVKTDVDALFLKCMTGVPKPNLPEDIPLQPSKQNIDTHGKKESISSDLVSQTLEPQFCGTNVEVSDEMFDKECDFHHKEEKDKSPVFFETCSPISKTSGLQFAQVSIGYYKDDIDPKDIEKHKIETERGSKSEAQIVDLPFKEMHAVSQPATHNLSYPIENVSTESIICQPCGIKTKEKMMQSNKISPKLEAELTAENVEGQQIIGDVLEKLATRMQSQIIETSSNFQNNLEEINGDRKQEIPFEKETTKYPNQSTSDTASTQNVEPFALTKDIVDTEFCTHPSIVEDILENPLLSCNNAQVASEFLLDDNKQKENYLPEFLLMRSTSKQSIDKNLILPKEFLNDENSTVETILSQSFQSEPDFEPQIDKTISSLLTETKSPETDIKDSDFTELLSLKSVEQRQTQDLEQETVDIAQKSLLITHATLSSKLEADETMEGTNLAKCPERLQKNTAEIDVSSGQVDDWDTYVFGKIKEALPSTTLNQENVCVHKTPQIQRDIEECKEDFVGIYKEPSIPMLEKKEIPYVLSENKVDLDKLPTESVSQIEKEKQTIIVSEVEDVDSKIDENSLIEQETYDVLEGVDEIKKEIEPAIKHMGSEIEAIAYKTVFPQEDHIFVQDEKGDVSKILSVSSKEFPHPPTIQILTPKADDVILKKSKITLEDLKYDIADILKEIDKDTLVEERETKSDVLPVVTTPTTQRRGLIGSQSLRLTRDNRPTPLDVSHIQTDEEDNEDYIVSEPGDNISRKSENSVCRVNSSPDIIGGTQHPLSQAWLIEHATKISEEPELERRRPMFHIESEEDDLSDQITDYYQQIGEHDELIAQINQGMSLEGVDQLGTNSRNLYIDKDNEKDHACTNTREVNATINDEMEKVPTSLEKTSEELIDGFSDQVEVADTEVKTISKSLDLDDQLKMLLPSKNKASKSLDLEDKIKIPSSDDNKLKRVERRFERMASETLEKEYEEGSTPEVEHRREAEFERMVSQLSIEEVADFQKEYSQLWDEGGMTPSEDWDSRDPDTPSGEIEADSPEQLPKEDMEEVLVMLAPTTQGIEGAVVMLVPTTQDIEGEVVMLAPTTQGIEGEVVMLAPTTQDIEGEVVMLAPTTQGIEGAVVMLAPTTQVAKKLAQVIESDKDDPERRDKLVKIPKIVIESCGTSSAQSQDDPHEAEYADDRVTTSNVEHMAVDILEEALAESIILQTSQNLLDMKERNIGIIEWMLSPSLRDDEDKSKVSVNNSSVCSIECRCDSTDVSDTTQQSDSRRWTQGSHIKREPCSVAQSPLESCRLTHDADQRESPAEGSLTKPFLPKPSPRLKPEPRDDFVTPQTSLETFGPEGPIAVSPLSYIGTVSHGVSVGMSPSETITEHDISKEDIESKSENEIDGDVQSYSDRKKFWEQMTGKSKITSTTSFEQSESVVTTKQRTISLDSTTPPVPRPRSTINTSPALTISALSEVPAKSETERDSETISFRTSLIHVQLPPVYLGKISDTTGSSDLSDREGSETEAKYIPSIPAGVPTTAPSAVAAITQGEIQSSLTESSDSEAEYIANFEGETLTYVNTGFVPDEEELEIPVKIDNKLKEKKDQIEIDASKQKESKTETLFKEMKKVNPLGVETSSILEKSFHHAAPIAITRKTLYERSVSLPTEDLIPFDHNGSVRAKKRYFEAQIKKEMVVDQLMTQLEEEASPEHKSIHQTTKELCTIVDQGTNITHQGHTDMFIHKPDKHNKPSLSEETEIATSKEKEVIETKIITVKDIAKGFEESKTWELKETMSKSKECKSKDLPKAVENEPFLESKTEEVKQEYATDLQTDTSKGRVNVSFDMEPTVKEVPKILKVKDLARGFEKESSFDGLEKDTKKDYVSDSVKTIDSKKPKEIVSGVAEEINMIYKTVICEKSEESDERKAVKDIRSVFESKIQGPTFDLISKIPIADTKKTSLAKTLSAEQPFGLKELSSNVQQVLLEEETKHDFEQGKSMGSQGETKEVINLVSGLEEESSSQKVIEVTQYKTDIFTKLSDSLEDHVDKSEIEGSEKEKYIDEDMTNIEKEIEEQGIKEVTLSEEPIPFITVTLSGIQRTESYIEGESEDTASESDVTPEDSREKAHPLYQPEEHIPDTVWEVPVQEQVETIMDEVVHDIPIEKQVIIEKDEDEYQEKSDEEKPVEEQDEGQDTLIEWPITEEEARVIAEEVIESIEAEVTKRAKLTSEFQLTSSSTRPIAEIAGAQVAELLKKLAGKEVLGPHEIQIMESILVRKQREQIKKISRTDTTTSSMEITDEDLRSSGVETDLSPLESHTGKLDIVEDTTLSEEMATELGIEDHETMKDGKSYIDIALEGEEVVEKTLAEVRESLGAAQEELIEEHKKKEEVIQKKESPSEFEFKVLTFENKLDEKIEESHFEDMSATADYIECDEDGKLITHATDIVSKDQYNKIEERTQLEKEEMGTTYDGIALDKTDTKAKEKEKHDFKFTETKLNDVRSEKNIQEGLVSETHTTASFSDEEDSLLKSKVIKTKTITKHGTGTSELTEDLLKEGTTSEYKICVETKIEGKVDSSVICKKDIKQAEEAKSKLKEKETTIEETDTGTMKTVVTEEKKSQSQVIKETKLENITSFSKYEKDDEVNLFIPESKEGILDAKAQPATITSVVKSLNNDKLHVDVYHSTLSSKREEKTEAITKTEHKVETTKTFEVDVESLDAMLAQKGLPPLAEDFETKEIVKDADQVACKEEIKRTSSEESQRSLSQDESAKSPVEAISSSSSTTTSGKRGDSEMVRVIERPDGSETTVVVLRHSRVPKDGESSSSGERSISAGANLRADRRSGADFEAWSSSGESHYHSFEQTSDSGRTYSRPCSSDAEALMAGAGTTGSSEYESALTSQEISSRSGITSQDYHTAVSSLSSRESMRSLDSESSGHLASIEVSSETSETLVPSALELEKDMEGVVGILTMDDDDIGEHRETTSRPPTVDTILEDKSVLEPYDTHIPVHIIRGESPPKIPHHRAYSITPSVISDLASTSERDYVATDFSHVDDGRLSPFEMISESDILDYPVDEIASEDEIDIPEPRDIERTTSTDESADDERPHCMKRSHEMIFQPEPRAIISDSPLSVSPVELQDEKFGSSVEEGSILSMSYSSTSEVAALRTVIELSRTDSERQDGSGASEQLSMTVSGTSEQLSLEDIDIAGALPVSQAQLVDFGTCTYPPSTSSRELHLSSVTITTSSVDEYGVQSVCTQVTSQSHTPVPNEDEDETVNIDEDVTQNGPTQVDYVPEYDDYEETHKRPMGHRRKESTSSFIPAKLKSLASDLSQDTTIIPEASIKTEIEGVEDAAESDKYTETMALTLKEVRSDEKKDIDEAERIEEESYQTEADQGFHRDLREGRVLLDDATETEEDTEAEIRDLDASRPHSQVSKSDSEGHRPISSGFSDDRPDSELTELLKQCSLDGGKDFEDPIERPLSPEPGDECEIKDDMPEFSSEAQASVKELEIEYSGAFSRSIGYASHVSPIREERIGKRYDEAGNMEISQLACEKPLSEHEDDMAEAEAAFQMASYAYSAVPSTLPATILEDPVAEKHELETRERTLKEKQKIQEAISPGGFIPDITVTQHMTPLLDKGFHYPDLELEEVARSASQTPASMSSRGSSETETDQGREYILEEEEEETDDYIAEENEHEAVLDEKGTETSHSGEEMSATEEKTVYETLTKESPKPILEQSSPSESPTSDSFEMLETPEITDDYVVIEEVGKEAAEHDTEGKSLHISKKKRELKKHDPQDDEVLIPSPPAPTTRMTDLKYYPEHGAVEEDMAPFPFEDSPPTAAGTKKSVGVRTQGFESGKDESDYEREVEAGKKWIEMQFQGDPSAAAAATGYGYEMEFERAPLEDIKEEEVNDFDQSSKVGSIGSYRESIGSFGSVKDSYSSTPEYDVLAGRRYFTRSGDHDDVSMSSLQEFEQLEHQIALEGTRKRIHGSQDSLNGSLKRTSSSSRSGQGDDISLSSLKEFEGLETACIEATKIETRAKEEEALLSEIEEGHESQVSESESCETMSAGGERGGESVDSDDYEKRMFEIDEIIRQAQTNVERFIDTKEKICLAESTESSVLDKTESVGRGDSMEEVARIPELDLDQPFYSQHGIISKTTQSIISKKTKQSWRDANDDVMQTSTDSLDLKTTKTSTLQDPLGSTNSLDIKTVTGKSVDMTASADSIDFQTQLTPSGRDDIMTDSIELAADSFIMANSTDSLEIAATAYGTVETGMTDSIEEESILGQGEGDFHESGSGGHDQSSSSGREGDLSSSGKDDSGEHGRVHPPRSELMLGSTDSLDPTSSTATHATYQYETDSVMSSSFTSGGSNTMVSSTDTLDPTGGAGGIDGIDLAAAARSGVWFEDVNGGGRHFVSEVIEPSEEDEFSHTIRRTVELPPEVRKVSFKGPDAERALREYVERFAPGKDVTESEVVDSEGNVHIKRVVQRRVVIRSEDLGETELTGPDLDEYLRHVAQQNGPGDDKQYSEERTGVPDSDYTHLMTSISGGDQTSFSSPSHSTEVVTHHTYVSRHITHPSSSGDVVTTTTQQETVAPYSTAVDDSNFLIVGPAINGSKPPVIVGNDTNLLVLLITLAAKEEDVQMLILGLHNVQPKIFSSKALSYSSEHICLVLVIGITKIDEWGEGGRVSLWRYGLNTSKREGVRGLQVLLLGII
uniref:Uncharacterized protein n=1 Tax=Timema shepardi TaxID=629360 RepID=A0A7R9FXJ7_TIMSH|nr:unnamed protein product [Timema shepardi]